MPIVGRSEDGLWLWVDCGSYHSWIAVQSVTTNVDVLALDVQAAPRCEYQAPTITGILPIAPHVEVWHRTTLTAEVSYHDPPALTYTWQTSAGEITGHGNVATYDAPDWAGSQTVTLTVQDELGGEDQKATQVHVLPALPAPGTYTPTGTLAQAWRDHAILRETLGWAVGDEEETRGVWQQFEHGVMFWREKKRLIYVLTDDHVWHVYEDKWQEGMDERSCLDTPTDSTLRAPHRGFGRVWCEEQDVPKAEIGWAQTQEFLYTAHWQRFQGGLMGVGDHEGIYILYDDHTWIALKELSPTAWSIHTIDLFWQKPASLDGCGIEPPAKPSCQAWTPWQVGNLPRND